MEPPKEERTKKVKAAKKLTPKQAKKERKLQNAKDAQKAKEQTGAGAATTEEAFVEDASVTQTPPGQEIPFKVPNPAHRATATPSDGTPGPENSNLSIRKTAQFSYRTASASHSSRRQKRAAPTVPTVHYIDESFRASAPNVVEDLDSEYEVADEDLGTMAQDYDSEGDVADEDLIVRSRDSDSEHDGEYEGFNDEDSRLGVKSWGRR